MERDFIKEIEDSSEVPGEVEKDPVLSSLLAEIIIINATQKRLEEKMRKEREQLHIYRKTRSYFEGISQTSTSPLGCLESPIESVSHESQNLSDEAFENLPDSGISEEALLEPLCELVEVVEEQSKDISSGVKSFEENMKSQSESLYNSPKKSLDNEIQASGSHTQSYSPSYSGIMENNEESVRYYVGKGKEAVNPAFRYKKGSKTVSLCDSSGKVDSPIYNYEKGSKANVSSSESLTKDSPIKISDEVFRSPMSKSHVSQSSKAGLSRISPAIKRKGSSSNEKDFDGSYASTSVTSKSCGNRTDNLNIAKKLKFEDDEKVSRQFPAITELLQQKKQKIIDLEEFMDQSQTDKNFYDREQLNLPSRSSLLNVTRSISNSEESSLGSGSEASSLGSGSEVILFSDREE